MTTSEEDWLDSIARENEHFERQRRMQPGRGQPEPRAASDWVILLVILGSIIAGFFQ